MLKSIHYHVCYLLVFLLPYQQQQYQALAVTIIIDGATTNEWPTRDEYQKLVSTGDLAGGAPNANSRLLGGGGGSGIGHLAPPSSMQLPVHIHNPTQHAALGTDGIVNRLHHTNENGNAKANGNDDDQTKNGDDGDSQTIHIRLPKHQHHIQEKQEQELGSIATSPADQQQAQQAAGRQQLRWAAHHANGRQLELDGSPSQLELAIETLERLQRLEQGAKAEAAMLRQQQQEPLSYQAGLRRLAAASSAGGSRVPQRTLADMAALGDSAVLLDGNAAADGYPSDASNLADELLAPESSSFPSSSTSIHIKKHQRSPSSPKNYCGDELLEIMDVICKGRFYSGQEPKIEEPKITRRSLGPDHQPDASSGSGPEFGNTATNNRHSKMRRYRQVRGITGICCERPCTLDEMRPYCDPSQQS